MTATPRTVATLLVSLLVPAASVVAQTPGPWRDAQGDPLPLKTGAEVQEFLRTAQVVELEDTARGVAGAQKALLRKDGMEMHAVFRSVAVEKREENVGGTVMLFFRDHYIHEPAAYALSELLGLGMVPPAVERTVRGTDGSLQVWLEDVRASIELKEKGIKAPDERAILLQYYQMQVFDNLVYNFDRNQGNILVDENWRGWLIDHTRAFVRDDRLRSPTTVRRCERGLWEKLQTLSDEEIEAVLEPYLPLPEREGLLKRRQRLVDLIREKIQIAGEDAVLFDRELMVTRSD